MGLICGILACGVVHGIWYCDLHRLFWYDWVDTMLNEWMQCWVYENWQDSQNAYVNTAIAYPVILTSGSGCWLLPRMQCANWPCLGLPYDGATWCEMREFRVPLRVLCSYCMCGSSCDGSVWPEDQSTFIVPPKVLQLAVATEYETYVASQRNLDVCVEQLVALPLTLMSTQCTASLKGWSGCRAQVSGQVIL